MGGRVKIAPNSVHVVWLVHSSEVLLHEYTQSSMHLENFCSINNSTKIHFPRWSIIERFDCGVELKEPQNGWTQVATETTEIISSAREILH